MAVEIEPLPPTLLSSQQLPLPLELGAPAPPRPSAMADVVGPQQVWPHLAAPVQAHLRRTLVRVIQEVLDDDDQR